MNDRNKALWFEEPVIGAMSPMVAAEKLAELGDQDSAAALEAAPQESLYRKPGEWRWPFRTKAWQHTTHAFGFISELKAASGNREIVDVGEIDADESLKRTRVKVT